MCHCHCSCSPVREDGVLGRHAAAPLADEAPDVAFEDAIGDDRGVKPAILAVVAVVGIAVLAGGALGYLKHRQ